MNRLQRLIENRVLFQKYISRKVRTNNPVREALTEYAWASYFAIPRMRTMMDEAEQDAVFWDFIESIYCWDDCDWQTQMAIKRDVDKKRLRTVNE